MKKLYKFQAAYCTQCPNLTRELERIEGGLPITVIDYDTPDGEALGKKLGVRGLPTMVKVEDKSGTDVVIEALAGYRHTRATFEKFLECDV